MSDLFRKEAIDYHAGRGVSGDVLRVAPRWIIWLFWALLASLAAGLGAAWFVRIDGERLISVLLGGG